MPTPPEHPDRHPPARGPVPMTVKWVLAVMLVTTLVAMHSHSPWSSLLRARNWRLPLGRALCLLLLGFPTLAKQGGKEEGGSRAAGEESGRAGEESGRGRGGVRSGGGGVRLGGGGEKPPTTQGSEKRMERAVSEHSAYTPPGPSSSAPIWKSPRLHSTWPLRREPLSGPSPPPRFPGAPEPRGTFLHVMTGKGSPAAAQGISSSRPASCLYSQPGSTVKYGGS